MLPERSSPARRGIRRRRAQVVATFWLFRQAFVVRVLGARSQGRAAPCCGTAGADFSQVVSLDGEGWLLATDPKNVGRDEQWWNEPRPDAKATKVPWIIQEPFPGYHGVAWYWRDFSAAANPFRKVESAAVLGRRLCGGSVAERMRAGSYGRRVAVVLDVTDAIRAMH
jgi:hypothetical protein